MPDDQIPQVLFDRAFDAAKTNFASRMGLEDLAPDVEEMISTKVRDALQLKWNEAAVAVADGIDPLLETPTARGERINKSLAVSVESVSLLAGDTKYAELLENTASMTYQKYQALQTAGFSEDQAFQLILAEAQNRSGHR